MKVPPRTAPEHAGDVLQNHVTLRLRPEKLHVRVEQVTLGGVDLGGAKLVRQL